MATKSKLFAIAGNNQEILREMYERKETFINNRTKCGLLEYIEKLNTKNGFYYCVACVTSNGQIIIKGGAMEEGRFKGCFFFSYANAPWRKLIENLRYSERLEEDRRIYAELLKNPKNIYSYL